MLNINSVTRNKWFERDEIEFTELESMMIDGSRYYMTPTGEKYPSVTTVLGKLTSKAIVEWRNRIGHEEANKITRLASTRGTRLHNMCEKYMLNHEDFSQKQMPLTVEMFKSIQPFIDSVELVYGNEIPLYSHTLKTAGRSDLFCRINGKDCILDFKSSSKRKNEEYIQNYFLQATCYAMMIEELKGINVPKLVILIAVEGDSPQVFIKNTADYYEQVRNIFSDHHKLK